MLTFVYSSVIPAPVEAVFAFHERPDAFELLTPPWQPVEVLKREGGLEKGAVVELLLRAGPFRIRWTALHIAYEKNVLFVDEQVRGPFRHWVHRHEFAPVDGGARLTDRISFGLFGGAPADWLGGWLAKQQLSRMFRYRHEVTRRECVRGPLPAS